MKIAVCVKQVPAGAARMDERQGTLLRTGEGALNPWDFYAIEAALQAGEQLHAPVTALSMGPASAREALRQAIAMGATNGALLSDSAFAGADVYATAFTLAQGMRALGGFELVFCGQQTADGDTAQLPFSLAVQLGARIAGWVKHIESMDTEGATVLQELSEGTQRLRLAFPAVLAVGREAATPRMPSLKNKLLAQRAQIPLLSLADLPEPDVALYGLAASPTRVTRVYRADRSAKAEALRLPPQEAVARILSQMGCGK